ncbi:MAG: hypothetical protein ABIK91_01140, partial [Pseudomonadota bacterium]
ISSPFGRVTRQEGIFEHNSGKPLLHAFFDEALCMNIGIPRVVGVGVEGITGRWRVIGQRFQNSPLRSGNNRITVDSGGDKQRQEGTRSLSSKNIMPP